MPCHSRYFNNPCFFIYSTSAAPIPDAVCSLLSKDGKELLQSSVPLYSFRIQVAHADRQRAYWTGGFPCWDHFRDLKVKVVQVEWLLLDCDLADLLDVHIHDSFSERRTGEGNRAAMSGRMLIGIKGRDSPQVLKGLVTEVFYSIYAGHEPLKRVRIYQEPVQRIA